MNTLHVLVLIVNNQVCELENYSRRTNSTRKEKETRENHFTKKSVTKGQ